jgi:chromodomain-helicase-DNA-binding protein 4
MQTGKKKLVLDHLIVQKMDDDDTGGDDVQSFLMYGAQALFNEDAEHGSKEFSCTCASLPKIQFL